MPVPASATSTPFFLEGGGDVGRHLDLLGTRREARDGLGQRAVLAKAVSMFMLRRWAGALSPPGGLRRGSHGAHLDETADGAVELAGLPAFHVEVVGLASALTSSLTRWS